MLYTEADTAAARSRVNKNIWKLCVPLCILLIGYVALIAAGSRWGMLAVLLAAFVWTVFDFDVYLLPEIRYKLFLKQMAEGLRRTTEATIAGVEDSPQPQDGAQVLAIRVELTDGSGERIFWLDTRKAENLPQIGMQVRLESCGRHITAIEELR